MMGGEAQAHKSRCLKTMNVCVKVGRVTVAPGQVDITVQMLRIQYGRSAERRLLCSALGGKTVEGSTVCIRRRITCSSDGSLFQVCSRHIMCLLTPAHRHPGNIYVHRCENKQLCYED